KGIAQAPSWLPGPLKDIPASVAAHAPVGSQNSAPGNLGPVEMDTIVPHDSQPPTLLDSWTEHYPAGYLTDKFGFIYDEKHRSNSVSRSADINDPNLADLTPSSSPNGDETAIESSSSPESSRRPGSASKSAG